MAIYKKVRKLSPPQAAYLAGLIDGEGTITLSRRNKDKHRAIVVTIANTELELLDYPKRVIGAGKIISKRTYKPAHTPSFAYNISGRQALDLLRQIIPFLHSYKKNRAELVLADYIRLTSRNGRYSTELLEEREKFIDAFFALKAN